MKKFLTLLCSIFAVTIINLDIAAAAKPVMAVAEFTSVRNWTWWRTGVGGDLSDMLTTELAATGGFRMVERSRLRYVQRELALQQSGQVSRRTRAKIGRLTGAKYIVLGKVSAFEQNVNSTGGGFRYKRFKFGGKSKKAYIAIDLRVVNVQTGVIEHVRTVEARSSSSGVRFGLSKRYFSGGLSSQKKTPVGKAIRGVIIEATDYLKCVMVDKDECLGEFKAKEKKRRRGSRGSIKLD